MDQKKILILGKKGQLGRKLVGSFDDRRSVLLDTPEINFSMPDQVIELIGHFKPALIINAAAYTNVDEAENNESLAYQVNAYTVEEIAKKSKEIGAAFLHFSTDFVFDGTKNFPYTEEDVTNPINIYGKSKLLGEQAIEQVGGSFLIFRLSWLYSKDNPCFLTRVISWSKAQKVIRLVDDQIGSPTSASMVADQVQLIIKKFQSPWYSSIERFKGIYHLAGSGAVSKFEWGKTILEFNPEKEQQITEKVLPAKTADFPSAAKRPFYSALNCQKYSETFGFEIPDWKKSLLNEIQAYASKEKTEN